MWNKLWNMADRIFVVLGALIFSQVPLYMHSYSLQLQGHVAELQIHLDTLQDIAFQTGKSLEQYVQKFILSPDADFRLQGEAMNRTIERSHSMSEALYTMEHATIWERPFFFIRYLDWQTAKSTMANFEIGIPLNMEGAVYAVVGILVGSTLFFLIRRLASLLFSLACKLVRRRKQPDPYTHI